MRVRPLEALNLASVGALSLLTLALARRLTSPFSMLAHYAILAAALLLIVAVSRRGDRLARPIRILLDFYPAAFIPLLYESLGPLIVAARGDPRDELLIRADRALFGVDVTVWLQRFVRPLWNDFFSIAYVTYYFIAIVIGALLWARHPPDARRFIFTLTVCYLVSYAGYFTVPALGPRAALRHDLRIDTTPIARSVSETLNQLEQTKFDVFPSGHTLIAVAVLIVAFQRARPAFYWLLPVAACLVISTVYCRYHYVVDVIAGTLLAFVSVPLGDALYDRLVRRSVY